MQGKTMRSRLRAAAAAAAVAMVALPGAASAQGFIDFLWGGDAEWGGSRQTVSFDPKYKPGQIIVSFGDRRLYLINRAGQAISYPIAVPREQSRWQGVTAVSQKRENPSWTPTPDMMKENPRLPNWVPGGHPMNPLGVRALYLGASTYRIHGTDAPWTIGQAVSKGCIRMFNEDVLDLYPRVPVGMKVTVTWDRFKTDGSKSDGYAEAAPAAPVPKATPVPAKRTVASASDNSSGNSEAGYDPSAPYTVDNSVRYPAAENASVNGEPAQKYWRKVGAGEVSRAATETRTTTAQTQ